MQTARAMDINGSSRSPAEALQAALASDHGALERMPGLGKILSLLPTFLVEELQPLFAGTVVARSHGFITGRTSDLLTLARGGAVAMIRDGARPETLVITADHNLIVAFLEASLGADRTSAPSPAMRDASPTELRLATILLSRIARSLGAAFTDYGSLRLSTEQASSQIDWKAIGRGGTPALLCRVEMTIGECAGSVAILIPQPFLEPFRATLSVQPRTDAPVDPEWSRHLEHHISLSAVVATAVLPDEIITLGQVLAFKIGDVIPLTIKSLDRVQLQCGDATLHWCEFGRQDGQLMLRVSEPYDKEQEFLNELFGR